jgi:plasmid replication initiation protein
MKNNLIRKSNATIQAFYDMNTPEMRLVFSCISKIGFKQALDANKMAVIDLAEYAETFGLDHSNARRELKAAVNSLWDRYILIDRPDDTPLKTRWISSQAEYRNGGAEIRFAVDVIPHLTTLLELGNFTMYTLEQISQLHNKYSIRLYELLKQYEKIGNRTILLEDLRKMFCLEDAYPRMCDFKRKVLDLAIEEINRHTDLHVSYVNIKRGRSITGFKFTISSRPASKRPAIEGRKYLTDAQVIKKAQTMRPMGNNELYAQLESEGYSFKRIYS